MCQLAADNGQPYIKTQGDAYNNTKSRLKQDKMPCMSNLFEDILLHCILDKAGVVSHAVSVCHTLSQQQQQHQQQLRVNNSSLWKHKTSHHSTALCKPSPDVPIRCLVTAQAQEPVQAFQQAHHDKPGSLRFQLVLGAVIEVPCANILCRQIYLAAYSGYLSSCAGGV